MFVLCRPSVGARGRRGVVSVMWPGISLWLATGRGRQCVPCGRDGVPWWACRERTGNQNERPRASANELPGPGRLNAIGRRKLKPYERVCGDGVEQKGRRALKAHCLALASCVLREGE